MIDSFVMLITFVTWLFRSNDNKLKKVENSDDSEEEIKETNLELAKKVLPYVLIVLSVKMSYFFDREKSLNFEIDP